MVYLLDTNVLLRFAQRRHPLHSAVRVALRTLAQKGDEFVLTPQICAEFWNVATRPTTHNGFGLRVADADRMLRLAERLFDVVPESERQYGEWRRLIIQYHVSGVQVHDARLVAAMLSHGLTHILTFNETDLERYRPKGIVASNPNTTRAH